jgi:3-deoxy-D-manno-octulosonic-acid transferase
MLRKVLGLTPVRQGTQPCAWFHAVSVGEVLLLRQVVARFRARQPGWVCVVSTTTNTGFEVARKAFPDLEVFYWPLFITSAKRAGCKVAVINGRMSPRSYRGYRRIRWLMKWLLGQIDLFAVQNQDYAWRLVHLGARPERVHVTGSVKYDGIETDRLNPKTRELGTLLAVTCQGDGELVWVAGSTQAPEEEIVLNIYRTAKKKFPGLRLILVPRHKERFDEIAALLERSRVPFIRRSQLREPLQDTQTIVLMDTLGELSALWGLADLAFVGGSLSDRGGQNMIEPAAFGVPVMFGPNVWNFQETADRLLAHHAAVQVCDAVELEQQTLRLLGDPGTRNNLGNAGQRFVLTQQGATDQTLQLLERIVEPVAGVKHAA